MKPISKKGFTLVELTVSIALISVVSVCIISFLVFLSKHTSYLTSIEETESQIALFENSFASWCGKFDKSEYEITVSENKISAGDENTFSLDENKYDKIKDVCFSLKKGDISCLLVCEIYYGDNYLCENFCVALVSAEAEESE